MIWRFIGEHRGKWPVVRMCAVMDVSPSGYHSWRKRPPSQREQANHQLVAAIRQVHQDSMQTYGSPRVHAELNARGYSCSLNRVARLMRQHDIRAKQRRRYKVTTQSGHHYPVAPNRLARQFEARHPNEKWAADITYIWTDEGWLYLAVVLDLFSRMVVGWAMDASLESDLVEQALRMALARRRLNGSLLHHSDQGSQYASFSFQALLADHSILASMSARGSYYDNAPMESFFATLKCELVNRRRYRRRAEARLDIFWYIEAFYNRQRRHSSLDYLSPLAYERRYRELIAKR
jgi:transposase InsO family protein